MEEGFLLGVEEVVELGGGYGGERVEGGGWVGYAVELERGRGWGWKGKVGVIRGFVGLRGIVVDEHRYGALE